MPLIELTKDNFEQEVLQSKEPVLVDFYGDKCSICKMMAPVMEEIAEENGGIKAAKLNISKAMPIARKYGVMSIPAFIVFKDGEAVERLTGEQSKNDILKMVLTD